ncbi:MAG: KH domain-containing protein, partial [Sphaerochaetaceae bacterium]
MEKELVEFLAKALVDNPDQVSVAEGGDGNEVVLKLSVAESDVGKV